MFLNNKGKQCHKWLHYFPIYERYLSKWINQDVVLLEIGVSTGGSLSLWKQYLGNRSKIIGIDVNHSCSAHVNKELDIHVRIGDQKNQEFLRELIKEFGLFDVIIDDGGHKMDQLWASFEVLYPSLSKNGVYIAEDLHTCYWEEFGGGKDKPESFINRSKLLIDELNCNFSRGSVAATDFAKQTFGIHYYNSMIVFEKGATGNKTSIITPNI
jgi:cephalosporin hydroxylase